MPELQSRWIVFTMNWGPAIFWAVLISVFSTGHFSSENTSLFVGPFLHWLFPAMAEPFYASAHFLVRKASHWIEYFILALLIFRGFKGRSKVLWDSRWAAGTLALALLWALLDEFHQRFVPERSGEFSDSLLDFVGSCSAVLLLYLLSLKTPQKQQLNPRDVTD